MICGGISDDLCSKVAYFYFWKDMIYEDENML